MLVCVVRCGIFTHPMEYNKKTPSNIAGRGFLSICRFLKGTNEVPRSLWDQQEFLVKN